MSAQSLNAASEVLPPPSLRDGLAYFLIAAVFFLALFPTLPWQQFGGDLEDLLVQPVLEMRHGGSWWIPTLGGEPRIRKPPLPTWISAAAVRQNTVAKLDSVDPAQREAAYRALAWEVRWPALLASALMLVAVGLTGQILAGRTVGLISAMFCGTMILFLRTAREATTDAYLAAFVSIANLFLALAIFHRRYWIGFAIAGISLGLANLCKGPVCLLQSVAPVAAYAIYCRRRNGPTVPLHRWLGPAIVGTSLMLLVTLPWYASVIAVIPDAIDTYLIELGGQAAKNIARDPIYAYIALPACILPWLGFFLLGWRQLSGRRIALAAFFVLTPVLLMTLPFFHDKKARYLMPILGPCAILAAHGATLLVKSKRKHTGYESAMMNIQWGTLLLFAIGVPVAGIFLKTADGAPWHSWPVGVAAAIVAMALLVLAIRLERRGPLPAAIVSSLLMLLPIWLALHGLVQSTDDLSDMKPIADRLKSYLLAHAPAGRVAFFYPPDSGKPVTLDLDIYLDQPVPVLHDEQELTGPHRLAAIVMMRRTDEPVTKTPPILTDWQLLFDAPAAKPNHPYHFYVLVPAVMNVVPSGGGR